MKYVHRWTSGNRISLAPGKVVCVGRNYADHARELDNPIPAEPILFMKPRTSMVDLTEPITIDPELGLIHHEAELSILIGNRLNRSSNSEARSAIFGIGLALDLTLRDLQTELKQKGHPWEKAKSFDGSCPLSAFEPAQSFDALDNINFQLTVSGSVRQTGNSGAMLNDIVSLLAYMSLWFTLLPGDVALTGTPSGVGPLSPGDKIQLAMLDHFEVQTTITSAA